MHFFGYGFSDPKLTYHVADKAGRLVRSEKIDVPEATMIHDFAITQTHAVFWIGPVVFGPDPAKKGSTIPFHWDASKGSRVGVMPLEGPASKIVWVDMPPCFVFHGLNAHDEGQKVVLLVHKLKSAFGPDGDLVPSHLHRWTIDLAAAQPAVRQEQLDDTGMDLPNIDRRWTGRQSRHGWFATFDYGGAWGFDFSGIQHLDLQTDRSDRWEPGPMERANEPLFVPGAPSEGDGWLMTFVYDRSVDRSYLGIFDAQHVAKGPVARVHLPHRVPYGFHGAWAPDAA